MKTHKNLNGIRYFKEVDDHIEMVRIYYAGNTNGQDLTHVYIIDEATKEKSKISVDELKDWTPLEPDGYITFNIVEVGTSNGGTQKDVIVTIQRIDQIKYVHNLRPFAICRQSITDIFANLVCTTEENDIVGLAVNENDCNCCNK